MRYTATLFFLLLIFNAHLSGQGADVTFNFDALKKAVGTVVGKKLTYEQSLSPIGDSPCKFQILIESVDSKGKTKSEKFEIYWSDIEKNSIKRNTKSDLIRVEFRAKKREPVFKYIKQDKVDGYEHVAYVLANNAENANEISNLLKNGISMCEEETGALNLPENLPDLKRWLNVNVQEIRVDGDIYTQVLNPVEEMATQLHLEYTKSKSSGKGTGSKQTMIFNLGDLLSQKTKFDVKGNQLFVQLETNKNLRLIQHLEEGLVKSYDASLMIYFDDVKDARDVAEAFRKAIKMGREELEASLPDLSDLPAALNQVKSSLKNIYQGDDAYDQLVEIDEESCVLNYTLETATNRKAETMEYTFNLRDFNPDQLNYTVVDKKVLGVHMNALGNQRYVQVKKDGTVQNNAKEIDLLVSNVEDGRLLLLALENAVPACKQKPVPTFTIAELLESLPVVNIGDNSFEQQMEKVGEDECGYQITRIENTSKKSTEYLYNFLLTDLDPNAVKMEISGKEIEVNLKVKKNQKLIKILENSETENYENSFSIIVPDIETGRQMVATWKALIEQCSSNNR